MKIKYNIEFIENDVKKEIQMEVYDDSLLFYADKVFTIMFDDIVSHKIEKNLLKIKLRDDRTIFISTIDAQYINDFIFLQKGKNYPLVFKNANDYMKKYFRNGFITGFLIVFIYNFAFLDSFVIIGSIFWGVVFGFIFLLVGSGSTRNDRARGKCPYCDKDIVLQHTIADDKIAMLEGEVGVVTCNSCGNKIGIKYNHTYEINKDNEKEFNVSKEETVKEKDDINEFEKLEKLKELVDKNVITQEEFEQKKKDILKKL